MRISRQAFIKMLQLVITFLENNEESLKDLPMFQELFVEIKQLQNEILDKTEAGVLKSTGAGEIKLKVRKEVESLSVELTSKLKAYAKFRNETMLPEVSITASDFIRFPEMEFVQKVNAVVSLAGKLGNLSEFRISEALIQKLEEKIKEFELMIHVPREKMLNKKDMNRTIDEMFTSARDVLKKIDYMMGILISSDPNLFRMYRDSRKIIDFPGRGLALKIRVLDIETKEPLKNAIVNFRTEQENKNLFFRKTAKKGGIHLKNLQPGTYTLTATHPGYNEKKISVNYTGDTRVKVVIPVEKSE